MVVDWHTGISRQLAAFGRKKGIETDWVALIKAWRRQALESALNKPRQELPRGNIDGVHRETLDKVLSEAGIESFSASAYLLNRGDVFSDYGGISDIHNSPKVWVAYTEYTISKKTITGKMNTMWDCRYVSSIPKKRKVCKFWIRLQYMYF